MDFKRGDRVQIIVGPKDKVGRKGTIRLLIENGAFVKLDHSDKFTPVQFIHLEKITEKGV